jgi:hypothetical protein
MTRRGIGKIRNPTNQFILCYATARDGEHRRLHLLSHALGQLTQIYNQLTNAVRFWHTISSASLAKVVEGNV